MKVVLFFLIGFLLLSIIIFVSIRSLIVNKKDTTFKITKLPENVDPNVILKREIIKKYGSKCPCCGEDKPYVSEEDDHWRAKIDGKVHPFKFWEKTYTWVRMKGSCRTCGAKWNLPAYPILDFGSDEASDIWNSIVEKEET